MSSISKGEKLLKIAPEKSKTFINFEKYNLNFLNDRNPVVNSSEKVVHYFFLK